MLISRITAGKCCHAMFALSVSLTVFMLDLICFLCFSVHSFCIWYKYNTCQKKTHKQITNRNKIWKNILNNMK